MLKHLVCLTSVMLMISLSATVSYGQLGVYEFDAGADGTSWDEAANWKVVTNADGTAGSGGNPATPPDAGTNGNIPLLGVVIDSTMPGQTARNVNIGTAVGAGSMSLSTGGGIAASVDFNVGSHPAGGANGGNLNMSGGSLSAGDDLVIGNGSQGIMTMSGGLVSIGDDILIDNDTDSADKNSSFTMTGGKILLTDKLMMGFHGNLHVNGGEIIAEDDFYILGNSTVTLDSGLMSTIDKVNLGNSTPAGPARLKINGGIMRSNEWTDNPEGAVDDPNRFTSIIEINGSGKMQVEQVTFSLAEAKGLIAAGRFITNALSPLHLGVQTVIVPEFFGATNVAFTQVSVVPEPTSAFLLTLGALGLLPWRKRTR